MDTQEKQFGASPQDMHMRCCPIKYAGHYEGLIKMECGHKQECWAKRF